MIEIVPTNYECEEYDSCGNTTIAVLKVNRITIPLCTRCLDELNESLSEFNNITFCYQCEKFIMDESGWRYGGSCRRYKDIELKDAGYIKHVDCMGTCKDAVAKSV